VVYDPYEDWLKFHMKGVKAMPLKAVKPESMQKRAKIFLYGDAGTGKTTAAAQFPQSYFIDTERGAENYSDLLISSGSVILQTDSIEEVITELMALHTEDHAYKTVVIDPATKLEDALIERLDSKYDGDMRMWRDRDRLMRRLNRLLLRLDMNVIVTAHGKIQYGDKMAKLGTTFDGWKRWPYTFDLVVEIQRRGSGENTERIGIVRKTRVAAFKDGSEFVWSYDELCNRYGREIIEAEHVPALLALPDQITTIKNLVTSIGVTNETVERWFSKEGVETFEEMSQDTIGKYIESAQKKLQKLLPSDDKKGKK